MKEVAHNTEINIFGILVIFHFSKYLLIHNVEKNDYCRKNAKEIMNQIIGVSICLLLRMQYERSCSQYGN